MKQLYCLIFLFFIASLVAQPSIVCAQEEITSADEGMVVLEEYFYDLKTGNTSEILNLMTGPLLKKRERLLKYNPQYGNFLKEKYENAQFSIIGQQFIDKYKLALDVQIIFTDQGVQKTRFILVQDNGLIKIYSEEDIPRSNQSGVNN